MGINKKHMIPRLAGGTAAGPGLRRGPILDGTASFKVFPGPRQRPDAAEGGTQYTPPGDWPRAGTLLRVPQVCWLSAFLFSQFDQSGRDFELSYPWFSVTTWIIPDRGTVWNWIEKINLLYPLFGGPTYWCQGQDICSSGGKDNRGSWKYTIYQSDVDGTYEGGDEFTCPTLVASGPGRPITGGPPPLPPGELFYHETRPNPYPAGYRRFYDELFPAVRARIEALRPGRTWVECPEWFTRRTEDDFGGDPTYWNGPDQDHVVLYSPHLGPVMAEPVFAPDFLHVTVGPPVDPAVQDGAAPNLDALAVDEDFQRGLGYLDRYQESMAGFACRMYGTNFPLEPFPPVPEFPFDGSPPSAPQLRFGTGVDGENDVLDNWVPAPTPPTPQDELAAKTLEYNANREQFNDRMMAEQPRANALCAEFAALSAEHGDVQYLGDQGHALDVDTLVALIADHFGFDPATGKDLG